MMVEELRRELLEEKAEHGKTMDQLREEAYKNKENTDALTRMATETGESTDLRLYFFIFIIFHLTAFFILYMQQTLSLYLIIFACNRQLFSFYHCRCFFRTTILLSSLYYYPLRYNNYDNDTNLLPLRRKILSGTYYLTYDIHSLHAVIAREKDDCDETKASTLSSDNDKPKKRHSVKQESVTPEILPEPGMSEFFSNELMDFFKFCGKKSMKMGKVAGDGEFDETYCTNALRLVRKGITSQCKRIGELEAGGAAGGGNNVAIPENEMVTRISNLQIELLIAQKAKNDVKVLKMKLMLMVEKMRSEKDIRLRNEEDMFMIKKKLLMLSDHTEKLMNHLKIEATTKLKIVETLRLSEKAGRKFQEKIGIMTRKSSAKDRLILELREGEGNKHFSYFISFRNRTINFKT